MADGVFEFLFGVRLLPCERRRVFAFFAHFASAHCFAHVLVRGSVGFVVGVMMFLPVHRMDVVIPILGVLTEHVRGRTMLGDYILDRHFRNVMLAAHMRVRVQ